MSGLLERIKGVKVEWVSLGEVAEIGTGNSNRQDENYNGRYPFFVRSQNILKSDSYQFDEEAIIIPGEGKIGEIIHYIHGKYALHQRAYRIHILQNNIKVKFLYYFMHSNFRNYILPKSIGSTSISIRKPMLEKFKIPIPPLEIQKEIVQILDTFTELTTELKNELTLRQKQYRYYRDKLLTFDGREEDLGFRVEWKSLGEVAQYSKDRISFEKINEDNYIGVENLLPNCGGKTSSSYVPTKGNLIKYQEGDILIGNIRPYLKKIWFADRIGGTNGDVLVIRLTDKKIYPRYLYQILADDKFFEYNIQHSKGAKMPRGNKNKILEYSFSIPPERNRIYP